MSTDKNKLIPELRFPEFMNDGDWDEKTIAAISNSESSSMALNKLELKQTGYPVYGADSIVGYIDEYQQEEEYISIVKDGSGVGRLNLCESHSSILGTLACLKSKNERQYNLVWFYYLLNTVDFSVYVKGSGIPHIYYSDFKSEDIAIPNPLEQQKIASCLSSLDEVIAAHSQKLDALKNHKKGLMQNLFPQEGETVPKYRFPQFLEDEEWEPIKLIDLAINGFSNGVFNDPKKVGKGYKLINVIDMYIETTINENKLSLLNINNAEFLKNKVEFGDVFFTRSSLVAEGIAKSNIYLGTSNDITFDGHLIRLRPNKDLVLPLFLHFILKTNNVRTQMIARGKTATMTTIGQSDVASVKLLYPVNPKEQQKIASCLSALDDLITAQAVKIKQLKLHKKGLMQGLFPKIDKVN